MIMQCTNELCAGKTFPIEPIRVGTTITNKIFITNNNYGTINNYGKSSTQYFDIPFEKNTVIYDDAMLNKLMIGSLNGSIARISEAMSYTLKANTCSVDGKLYRVKGFVWAEIEADDVCGEFSNLYDVIDTFMHNNANLSKETKNEGVCIVSRIKDRLMNPTNYKNIIRRVIANLKKDGFSTNANLIAFKNGVLDMDTMVFRNGTAGDMIDYALPYDYSAEYVDESGMMDTLNIVFPEGTLDYFLMFLAMGLCRKNCDERMLILCAINEKVAEMVTRAICNVLGRYCCHQNGTRDELRHARILTIDSCENITNDTIDQYVRDKTIKTPDNNVIRFNAGVVCVCTKCPLIDNNVIDNVGQIRLSEYARNISKNKMDVMLLILKHTMRRENIVPVCVRVIIPTNPNNAIICERFLHKCTVPSRSNVRCVDLYDRYLRWAETNNEPIITKQKLFVEVRKTIRYSKNAMIDGKRTSGFAGIAIF